MIRFTQYSPALAEQMTVERPDEVLPLIRQDMVNWLDLDINTALLEQVCMHFNLHPHTIEETIHHQHLPKYVAFENYIFFSLKMLSLDPVTDELKPEQVSFILGEHYVLSFQEGMDGDVFDGVRTCISEGSGRIRQYKSDFLLYSLLDAISDQYFNILEHYRERIDELEQQAINDPSERLIGKIMDIKNQVTRMRKYTFPLKEEIARLRIDGTSMLTKSSQVYFRDLQDHISDLNVHFEHMRDMLKDLTDLYLSNLSHSLNRVMKTLTIVASLFIPLTFVAGIYRMNFKHMPELEWTYGYPLILLVMGCMAVTMLLIMKQKKWF